MVNTVLVYLNLHLYIDLSPQIFFSNFKEDKPYSGMALLEGNQAALTSHPIMTQGDAHYCPPIYWHR